MRSLILFLALLTGCATTYSAREMYQTVLRDRVTTAAQEILENVQPRVAPNAKEFVHQEVFINVDGDFAVVTTRLMDEKGNHIANMIEVVTCSKEKCVPVGYFFKSLVKPPVTSPKDKASNFQL